VSPQRSKSFPPLVAAQSSLHSLGKGIDPSAWLERALTKATSMPASVITAHVNSLRRRNPLATPNQIIEILSREFLMVLQGSGGAVGATAAIPAVGTSAALVLSAADLGAFFAAASAFSLAVAEVHGVSVEDSERRRALVLASVLGESGAKTVLSLGSRPSAAWGTTLLTIMPNSTIKQVNSVLSSRFIKRRLLKHGGLIVGRVVPFGIGAAVGVWGGRSLAKTVIHQATRAFGSPPNSFAVPVTSVIATDLISDDIPTSQPRLSE